MVPRPQRPHRRSGVARRGRVARTDAASRPIANRRGGVDHPRLRDCRRLQRFDIQRRRAFFLVDLCLLLGCRRTCVACAQAAEHLAPRPDGRMAGRHRVLLVDSPRDRCGVGGPDRNGLVRLHGNHRWWIVHRTDVRFGQPLHRKRGCVAGPHRAAAGRTLDVVGEHGATSARGQRRSAVGGRVRGHDGGVRLHGAHGRADRNAVDQVEWPGENGDALPA